MRQVSTLVRAVVAASAVVIVGAVFLPIAVPSPAWAACEGERVDKTTADDARKKMQAAGYTQVRELKKGCDSVWHGVAQKGGATVRVLVNPQGQVMEEGN